MNTDKNTALYEKMAAEQDKFRDWLKSQPSEEILNHAYEYIVREDILMAMEELDLPQSRAAALLASPSCWRMSTRVCRTGRLPHGCGAGQHRAAGRGGA
ncbi:hypothetical protein OBE_14825, partial [human gut metagenome]